jgi:hypothetical protein
MGARYIKSSFCSSGAEFYLMPCVAWGTRALDVGVVVCVKNHHVHVADRVGRARPHLDVQSMK